MQEYIVLYHAITSCPRMSKLYYDTCKLVLYHATRDCKKIAESHLTESSHGRIVELAKLHDAKRHFSESLFSQPSFSRIIVQPNVVFPKHHLPERHITEIACRHLAEKLCTTWPLSRNPFAPLM